MRHVSPADIAGAAPILALARLDPASWLRELSECGGCCYVHGDLRTGYMQWPVFAVADDPERAAALERLFSTGVDRAAARRIFRFAVQIARLLRAEHPTGHWSADGVTVLDWKPPTSRSRN